MWSINPRIKIKNIIINLIVIIKNDIYFSVYGYKRVQKSLMFEYLLCHCPGTQSLWLWLCAYMMFKQFIDLYSWCHAISHLYSFLFILGFKLCPVSYSGKITVCLSFLLEISQFFQQLATVTHMSSWMETSQNKSFNSSHQSTLKHWYSCSDRTKWDISGKKITETD